MNTENKPKLKLIRGGGGVVIPQSPVFISAIITNTRLMGVVGIHAVHDVDMDGKRKLMHSYFYFDIEENGLETIDIYLEGEIETALAKELSMFGGLGGENVPLTKEETLATVQDMYRRTAALGKTLPENANVLTNLFGTPDYVLSDDYKPILKPAAIKKLISKSCVYIKSDCGIVNYYLMRLFGHDFAGAELLRDPGANPSDFEDIALPNHATFLRNKVTQKSGRLGFKNYYSESLVESGGKHYVVSSELEIVKRKVTHAEKGTCMAITDIEASMLLGKDELVSVYDIDTDSDDDELSLAERINFDSLFNAYSIKMTASSHPAGVLLMDYKPNNLHVEKHEYYLNEDVAAIYLLSDYDQLIVAAYSIADIIGAEQALMMSELKPYLTASGRYRFRDSVMLDFAESDFEDFNEYVAFIRG